MNIRMSRDIVESRVQSKVSKNKPCLLLPLYADSRWRWVVGGRIVGHSFEEAADSVNALPVVVVDIAGIFSICFLLAAEYHTAIVLEGIKALGC